MHLEMPQAFFCRALSRLSSREMSKCIVAGSVNAFGYVLWETHSLFFCFDTAPDLL